MNIALLGASGRTGALVLQKLLASSHNVKALARTPARIDAASPRLTVIQGDALVLEDVQRTIEDCDAVISVLGNPSLKASSFATTSVGNIVAAMQTTGTKRIIYMASAGILGEMGGLPGLIVGIILRRVLRDHRGAYDLLQSSQLEWTVLRPVGLTDQPATGAYRVATTGLPKNGRTISRADVAGFIVQAVEQGSFVRESPALAD